MVEQNSGGACQTFLAVDLGAGSGRVAAGWIEQGRFCLEEVHRFPNEPVKAGDSLAWNVDALEEEILTGLSRATALAKEAGRPVRSVGIDSWAVDFALLDDTGQLLGPVVHYRDSRTDGMMDDVFGIVPRREVFEETGIQFLQFNTLYQLVALKRRQPELLERARRLLMIPDYFVWKLTGEQRCEFTNATTTQLFNPVDMEWSEHLATALDLPLNLFAPLVLPGEPIGKLSPAMAERVGAELEVTAVASHDTGSAVLAVPASSEPFAYISCGTWSLLGTEVNNAVINEASLRENFTNEGGAEGTFRLLKNIMGLWILQECVADWAGQGKRYTWDEVASMAAGCGTSAALIPVDDPIFFAPGGMVARVKSAMATAGINDPDDATLMRCVLDSLAARYGEVLALVEELTGTRMPALHIVGGGVNNELLCQLTANRIGRPVLAGPSEATAAGNIGSQMIAAGLFANRWELRRFLAGSFDIRRYDPE